MEFYDTSFVLLNDRKEFQFPTGWNSTSYQSRETYQQSTVSIPNGMEFYQNRFFTLNIAKNAFQFPTGWNSTCETTKDDPEARPFQFPTGWNSTQAVVVAAVVSPSFNSQRDGILQHEFCHFSR